MDWKRRNRSFYYRDAPEPADPPLVPSTTAFLVIDVQNTYLDRPDPQTLTGAELRAYDDWTPFHDRMRDCVVPNISRTLADLRSAGVECLFARIACLTQDGRDRSLSQKLPGWNEILLPYREAPSQLVEGLQPVGDEIVVTKTTDSALTGTNLRLILANLGIRTVICAGIFTDQCISSTVRSLADESFHVVVLEDCCAAGTMALHARELEVLNMIYCHVMRHDELIATMGL